MDADLPEAEAEHEALLGFLYMCPVGVLRLDESGAVQLMNPMAAQLLQERIGDPLAPNLFDALDACAPELRVMAHEHAGRPGAICENHRVTLRPDGERPLVVACTLLRTAPGVLMAVLQDVTRQVLQERLLRQHEVMLDALIAGVNDFALFALDRDGRISTWNHSCVRQVGLTAAEAIGRGVDSFCRDEDGAGERLATQVDAAAREGWSLREGWCHSPGNRAFRCQVLVAAVSQDGGGIGGYSVVLRDVTQRRMSVEEVGRLLTADHLTGAANRRRFFDLGRAEVERSRQEGRPLSLVMLDVDHFKRINDRHGHAVGDEVLRRLVACCAALCRPGEVLARLGGEEFAVLLPGLALEAAEARAESMRRAVAGALSVLGRGAGGPVVLGATISLGCAALDGDATLEELMGRADAALYAAKRGGRDQVRCADAVLEAV